MSRKLLEGLHRLSREERLSRVANFCDLSEEEVKALSGEKALDPALAENWIENVLGYFSIPMGVATNFVIDGKEMCIPMVVEETSIIAACSSAAKWVSKEGAVRTYSKGNLIIGQIQIPHLQNLEKTIQILHEKRASFIAHANLVLASLVKRGGGVQDLEYRELEREDGQGKMLVIHVLCNPCDAMGANLINQVCEALKPLIEDVTGEKVGLCILSNLVDTKLAGAEVVIRNLDPALSEGIVEASQFAKTDVYRATTHNKGVLNGIDPILLATGNDWRAVEAGIHAYASRSGKYQPITDWKMKGKDLVGTIEVPMALGIVGGVTKSHPLAKIALKMMKIETAEDLARICVAVGLVQNLAALKALSTVGIVKGHMSLHASNLALAAGAEKEELPVVRERLAEILKVEKYISLTKAREILEAHRGKVQDHHAIH